MKSPYPQKTKNMKNGNCMADYCPLMGLTDRKRHNA